MMRGFCALLLLGTIVAINVVILLDLPANGQTAADPFTIYALQARKAMADGDLNAAENFWLAALQTLNSVKNTPAEYIDPRYYYGERWLGVTMLLEKKAAAAEGLLAPACQRSALTYSLQNEDVRATVDVYAQILQENSKPTTAKEAIELWNSIITGSSKATAPALSNTPSALSDTSCALGPSALSGTASAMSNTPSAFQPQPKTNIPVPPMPPAAPIFY